MKRIFAFITALALVIGMLPTAYAGGEAEKLEYLFNLSSHIHAQAGETDIRNGDFRIENMSASTASAPWGFLNSAESRSLKVNENSLEWQVACNGDVCGAALGFEISVGSSGGYVPELRGKASVNGFVANAFLMKKPRSAEEWMHSSNVAFSESIKKINSYYYLGEVDFGGAEDGGEICKAFDPIDIKASGEYFLVLVFSEKSEGAQDSDILKAELSGFILNEKPENTAQAKEFDAAGAYRFKNTGASYSASTADGVFSATNIEVRRYGVAAANGSLAVFGVQTDKSGTYNISFKSDEVAAINSAAPAIYVIEDDGSYTGNTNKDVLLSGEAPVGYFKFSGLKEADEYMAVTVDGTEQSDASSVYLDSAKKYFIVMYMDAKSFYLNDVADTGDLGNKGYSPAEGGGVKNTSGTLLGKSNYQVIRCSGIKLTPGAEVTGKQIPAPEIKSAKLTVEKDLIFVGGSAKSEISVLNELDEPWTYEHGTVYKASNNNVSINASGVITGIAKGDAEIWAEVTVDDKTVVTDKVRLEVLPIPTLDKLVISSDKAVASVGESVKLTVSGFLTDGAEADMESYEVSLSGSNPEVATVSPDGTVEAHKAGLAVITARAINEDGNEIICKYSFNVGSIWWSHAAR